MALARNLLIIVTFNNAKNNNNNNNKYNPGPSIGSGALCGSLYQGFTIF